jgi:hypothetical protein
MMVMMTWTLKENRPIGMNVENLWVIELARKLVKLVYGISENSLEFCQMLVFHLGRK